MTRYFTDFDNPQYNSSFTFGAQIFLLKKYTNQNILEFLDLTLLCNVRGILKKDSRFYDSTMWILQFIGRSDKNFVFVRRGFITF